MRLLQWTDGSGTRRLGVVEQDPESVRVLAGVASTLELAQRALIGGASLAQVAAASRGEETSYAGILARGRLLPPVDHPDLGRWWITGTGLTHLGSAKPRDAMRGGGAVTDTMRMFQLGVAGGRPATGVIGAQPEWFFKGDGACVVAPGADLAVPGFGLDAGEEPELVCCYLIDADGRPWRLGHALGNELSDHVLERQNYLCLAHSKLRPCSFGPELRLGPLPAEVRGQSRIRRDGAVLWERPWASGEAQMAHSLANIEHHHFKYDLFRRPGQLHCHFLGTATLSFADGICTCDGDQFEISAAGYGRPLVNRLRIRPADTQPLTVRTL